MVKRPPLRKKAKWTHFDGRGNALMVDVLQKLATAREAVAAGTVLMKAETVRLIMARKLKKGDVLVVAQLAGIAAAKRTSDLIPLCHPLALSSVKLDLNCDRKKHTVNITASCKVNGATGVEMEALTAVAVAALTVYDMCKSVDRGMKISRIRLLKKSGGKSGTFIAS